MVFNAGESIRPLFKPGGQQLEMVRAFEYLGVVFEAKAGCMIRVLSALQGRLWQGSNE